MSRSRVPGPLRRLTRQPLRLTAIVLLSATAIAAAGVNSAATEMLRVAVDDNWRGDYDILVTATDELPAVQGKLPPNALAGGSERMSLAQWQQIQQLDGVEVAAPIGEILVPGLKRTDVELAIPEEVLTAADEPQVYRVTATYTTDDGLGERVVDQRSTPLILDPTGIPRPRPEEIAQCRAQMGETQIQLNEDITATIDAGQYPVIVTEMCEGMLGHGASANYPTGDGWGASTVDPGSDVVKVSLPSTPETTTRITLIDPLSEQRLLGQRGAFLDPLIELDTSTRVDVTRMDAWATQAGGEYGERFHDLLRQQGRSVQWTSAEANAEWRQLYAENGLDLEQVLLKGFEQEGIMPLVVSDAQVAELTVRVDVEAFGETSKAEDMGYMIPEAVQDGAAGEKVGSVVGDVSRVLNPFSSAADAVAWPGADPETAASGDPWRSHYLEMIGSDAPTGYDEDAKSRIHLSESGFADPVRPMNDIRQGFALSASPERPGVESAYTRPKIVSDSSSTNKGRALAAPIGSFDPHEVALSDNAASWVPLGAYAPVGTTLASGEHAGATIQPGLSGLGLVSSRTVAIGSIHSAAYWQDETPISAVRVRVGDVEEYTADARRRVVAVAQRIEQLGLSASIVAGSSPADAEVTVDGYTFGVSSPDDEQQVGELGTISQKWSELGAAARVSLSISTSVWVMLAVALGSGVLLMVASSAAAIPGRRAQAAVMREIGFPRQRIVRWFAAEEIPGLVIVAVIAVTAWALSDGSAMSAVASGCAVGAVTVAAAAAVVSGARAPRTHIRDSRSRRLGARSVYGFGARQVRVHPLITAVHATAIVIIGLAAGVLAEAVQTSRLELGGSALADLVAAQQLVPQLIMGLVAVLGGALLARTARGVALTRLSEQWDALRTMGWTRREVVRAQRAEGLTIAVPAILIVAGCFAAAVVLAGVALMSAAIAIAGSAIGAVVTFAFRSRGGGR